MRTTVWVPPWRRARMRAVGDPAGRNDPPGAPYSRFGRARRGRRTSLVRRMGARDSALPADSRERAGFQSNARLGGARSTGNLRARENRPGGPSPGRPCVSSNSCAGPCGPVRSGNMAPRGDRSAPEGLPPPSSGLAAAGAPARWCAWDSWGGPGRGLVQICCKGVLRPDRPGVEPRNINDSPPAPRRDGGLCNRFGQPAPPRAGRRPQRTPRSAGRTL